MLFDFLYPGKYSFKPKADSKRSIMLMDSKEDGGIGFEEIAESLGWKTNTSPNPGGDPKAIKGGNLTMLGGQ